MQVLEDVFGAAGAKLNAAKTQILPGAHVQETDISQEWQPFCTTMQKCLGGFIHKHVFREDNPADSPQHPAVAKAAGFLSYLAELSIAGMSAQTAFLALRTFAGRSSHLFLDVAPP